MKKAIILARVSTEEQKEANNSIPAQLHRLKTYCNKNNYQIIQTFEIDESAYKETRKSFDSLMNYVLDLKEPVIICCDN